MGYKKAVDLLPIELLEKLQKYVEGEYIYIPRKSGHRKSWGELKNSKQLTFKRNCEIYARYAEGSRASKLAQDYFLSPKTIYKIISKFKQA